LDNTFARRIEFEISEIDLLLESHPHLLEKGEDRKTSGTETLALAALLHAFYNSIENIFLLIARDLDGKVPEGMHRHRTLLDAMSRETRERRAVVSESVKSSLKAYLGFYKLFRNVSTFDFDKRKLAKLAEDLFLVWESLKIDLRAFVKSGSESQTDLSEENKNTD
jgi:hypothetical protein